MTVNRIADAYSSDQDRPELSDLARVIIRRLQLTIRVAMPCTVVKFRPLVPGVSVPSVDVQPGFKFARRDDKGDQVVEDLKPIMGCPILFFAIGGFKITVPPKVGEEGLLLILDRNSDSWLARGGSQYPQFSNTHNLGDGVFIPGLRSVANALDVMEGTLSVGLEDGTAGLEIDEATGAVVVRSRPGATITLEGDLRVGASDATEPLVLGQVQLTQIQALTVPTAMGPSGTPINAAAFQQALSVRHRIDS